jgi:hypothetical protein
MLTNSPFSFLAAKDRYVDWNTISNLSPGLAFGVVCLYLYNLMAARYLEERKEMFQTLMAERREWAEAIKQLNQQYVDLLRTAIEAIANIKNENHALRGKIQEFMSTVEARFTAIDNLLRGRNPRGHND